MKAITVKNLTKIYKLYDEPSHRMLESFHPLRKRYHREFHALHDVSFEIDRGQTVGIIGRNGSGKSTLLKIITGVLNSTTGIVCTNGRISSLLELGAGFNPDYTGIENVYLQGTIMGMTKDDIAAKMDDILEFADIGEYVNHPVKTYSSGMFVRLAFAVAINVEPDILIVDEALSVGDARFQIKCFERIKQMQDNGKTILFVSHDLQTIKQFCDMAILIDAGKLIDIGAPNPVINHYTKILFAAENSSEIDKELVVNGKLVIEDVTEESTESTEYRYGTQKGLITDADILDGHSIPIRVINSCDETIVKMVVKAKKNIEKPIYAITIKTTKGLEVYGTNTYYKGMKFEPILQGELLEIRFRQRMCIMPGSYFLSFGFVELEGDNIIPLDRRYDAIEFKVLPQINDRSFGIANLDSSIEITCK